MAGIDSDFSSPPSMVLFIYLILSLILFYLFFCIFLPFLCLPSLNHGYFVFFYGLNERRTLWSLGFLLIYRGY